MDNLDVEDRRITYRTLDTSIKTYEQNHFDLWGPIF